MASLFTSDALKALKLKLSTKRDKENQPVNSDGQTEFKRPVLKSNVSLLSRNRIAEDNDSNPVCSDRPAVRENGDQDYSLINEEQNQNVQRNREDQEVVDQVREREARRAEQSQQASSAPDFSFAIPQSRAPKSARPSTFDAFNNFKQTFDDFYNNEIMTDCEMDYYLLKLTSYALKNLDKATKNVRSEDDGFSHSALMDSFQRTGLQQAPSLVGSYNSYIGRNSVSRFSVGNGLQISSLQTIHQPFGEREREPDSVSQYSSHVLPSNARRRSFYQMPRHRSSIMGSECGDSVFGGPYPRSTVSSSRPSLFSNPFEQDRIAPYDLVTVNNDGRVDEDQVYQRRNNPDVSNSAGVSNMPRSSNNYNSLRRHSSQAPEQSQYSMDQVYQRRNHPDVSNSAGVSNMPRSSNNYNSLRHHSSQAPKQSRYSMDGNFIAPMNRSDDRSQPQVQSSQGRSSFVPGTPATSRYGRVIRTPCFYKANDYSAAHDKAEIPVRERSHQTGRGEKQPKVNDKVGERSFLLSNSRTQRHSILEDRPIRNQKRKREDSIGEEEAKRFAHTPHPALTSKDNETSLRTRSGRIVREPVKFWSQDYSPVSNAGRIIEERPNLKRKRSSITHHGETVAVKVPNFY